MGGINREQEPILIALVATCNRPQLLACRSLPSIAKQTRLPDALIVADDSDPQYRKRNEQVVAKFSARSGIRTDYIVNHRNRGVSGCWNCGVLAALDGTRNADNTYLAILDDDDQWLDCHIANIKYVLSDTGKRGVDFIAASFQRREPSRSFMMHAPEKLKGRDFLVGSPGAIGSTMIIRLSTFMRAGMFDESLSSCTDRDLCFRLSLLPDLNYHPLHTVSVVHHADADRVRISNRDGATKINGLSYFVDKYRGWMTAAEYAAFCDRAKRLFGWDESDLNKLTNGARSPRQRKQKTPVQTKDAISLVIGMIMNSQTASTLVFDDIIKLSKDKRLISTDVVILPCADAGTAALEKIATRWRCRGLNIHCADEKYVGSIMRALSLFSCARKPRSIAVNRTILQHALFTVGGMFRNPAYWILDDDLRLHGLQSAANKPTSVPIDYIGEMLRLRGAGCDVAMGAIHGAPPLPRALSVRTQMVDLLHYFARLNFAPRQRHFPKLTITNMPAAIADDYYHDCANHPHLEQPIGVIPLPKNCSRDRFIGELPKFLELILAGDAVTRPLLGGVADALGQRHRGGNTLIFNAEILRACPNGLLHTGFTDLRRHDEVWRMFGEAALDWNLSCGNFPVTQQRATDPPQAPDLARIRADIAGHAISSALRIVIAGQRFDDLESLIKFLSRNCQLIFTHYEQLACLRMKMLRVSFARIVGIACSMRAMLGANQNSPTSKRAVAALQAMEKRFTWVYLPPDALKIELREADFGAAIANFPFLCQKLKQCEVKKSWLANERQKNAYALLARSVKPKEKLRTRRIKPSPIKLC